MTGLPIIIGEAGPLPGSGQPAAAAKAVRLFPKSHEFPLADWSVGGLCRWMIEHGLPLFIWHTELQWADLYELAQAFPGLVIVVESQPQKIIYHVRPLHAVMGDCPNVSVEVSNLTNPSFGWLVGSFGPERFFFGSFLPADDPMRTIRPWPVVSMCGSAARTA